MSTFLLEINSPSMPATEVISIDLAVGKIFTNHFASIGLVKKSSPMVAMCTYGRLVVTCEDMQDMSSVSVRGPKTSSPSQAVDGFLKKYNAKKEDLIIEGDYYVFTQTNTSEDIEYAIKDATLECLNQCALEWKSTLSIGCNANKWVRPISSIVCLFNEKIVNFEFCGVEASNVAFFAESGNIASQDDSVTILNLKHYFDTVNERQILLTQNERVAKVTKMINETCDKEGIYCDLSRYQGLLQEVCAMVESPHIFVGKIPEEYKDVPNCTKVYTMVNDQRYFPCSMGVLQKALNKNDVEEQFCNFIFVSNKFYAKTGQREASVIKGNETVLNARLADQKFYWNQDLKKWQGKKEQDVRKMLSPKLIDSCNEIYTYMEEYLKCIIPNDDAEAKDKCLAFAKAFVIFAKLDMETKCVLDMPEVRGFIGSHMWRLWCDASVANKEEYAKTMEFQHAKSPIQIADFEFKTLICPVFLMCNALNHIVHHVALGHIPTPSGDPYTVKRAADMFIIAQEQLKKVMSAQNIKLNAILNTKTPINEDTFDILKKAIVRVNGKLPLVRRNALNHALIKAGNSITNAQREEIDAKLNLKPLQTLVANKILKLKPNSPTCASIDLMVEHFSLNSVAVCIPEFKSNKLIHARRVGIANNYKGDERTKNKLFNETISAVSQDEFQSAAKLAIDIDDYDLLYNSIVNCGFSNEQTEEEIDEIARLAIEIMEKAGFDC